MTSVIVTGLTLLVIISLFFIPPSDPPGGGSGTTMSDVLKYKDEHEVELELLPKDKETE